MTIGYLRHIETGAPMELVEFIEIDTGATPPPRPHPTPPDPDAPRPSHPIALPGDPWWGQDLKPTHPIVLPGDPSWGTGVPKVVDARVSSVPEGVEVPDAPPADATKALISFGKGTKPAAAWIAPYPSTGPVE